VKYWYSKGTVEGVDSLLKVDTVMPWPIMLFSFSGMAGRCVCDGAHWLDVMKNSGGALCAE